MHFIDTTNFERFLKKLSAEGQIFVPVRSAESGKIRLNRVETFPLPDNLAIDGYRTVEPAKSFAQLLRFPVCEYPSDESDEVPEEDSFPGVVVVGVRGCDLVALSLVDKVEAEGDFIDPFYKIRRKKMILIGADCGECGKSCFCNLLGAKPWPEHGCDIAIAKVQGGYIVESMGERGAELISENSSLFAEARELQLAERESRRAEVMRRLEEQNRPYPKITAELTETLRSAIQDEVWNGISARCVECGACTNICPTCYCFLLYDQRAGSDRFQRIFTWDSCQVTGYARMAGMLNPRPRLTDRVKHRYYHKYDYLPLSHGAIFCTGCGRCIDTCSASIDMREALKQIKEEASRKKA